MENYEKYLPIGSVVMLKGGKKRAMITGFCSIANEDPNRIYDYCGCIYPEGYMSSDEVCLFDHVQIDQVYHVGLVDDEETQFKNRLKMLAASLNSGEAQVTPEANALTTGSTTEPTLMDTPVFSQSEVSPVPAGNGEPMFPL